MVALNKLLALLRFSKVYAVNMPVQKRTKLVCSFLSKKVHLQTDAFLLELTENSSICLFARQLLLAKVGY